MRYHMIAVSLPRKGYYLCLHKHGRRDLCTWTEDDRSRFLMIRDQIRRLYEAGPVEARFSRPEVDLLFDGSITPTQAVNRVLPYYLEATPPNQKRVYYIEEKESDIEVLGPAGTEDERYGLRLVTVLKDPNLPPDVPPAEDLDGRSCRALAETVAWSDTAGNARTLAVPAERTVRVSSSKEGEFVTEIPEVWA